VKWWVLVLCIAPMGLSNACCSLANQRLVLKRQSTAQDIVEFAHGAFTLVVWGIHLGVSVVLRPKFDSLRLKSHAVLT